MVSEKPVLTLRCVTKKFGELKALDCVNLQVFERELLSIIGPNGAGKTTLINVITGETKPDSGKVMFGNEDITGFPPHILVRKGLTRSFQITNIFFGLSVKDNLRLALIGGLGGYSKTIGSGEFLREVDDECENLIRRLGLEGYKNHIAEVLPYGLQRILEIGICLAVHPKIIFLDEFTAGLTIGERIRLGNLVKNLVRVEKITSVITEHDLDLIFSISDRIVVMHQGKIIAEGSPEEIKENELVKEVYLGP